MNWVGHSECSVHFYSLSSLTWWTALRPLRLSYKIMLKSCFTTFRSPSTATASSIVESVGLCSADHATVTMLSLTSSASARIEITRLWNGSSVSCVARMSDPRTAQCSTPHLCGGSGWHSRDTRWLHFGQARSLADYPKKQTRCPISSSGRELHSRQGCKSRHGRSRSFR